MNRSTVEFYQDHERLWRWRFIAPNGHILADSGQGYQRLRRCKTGWTRIRTSTAVEITIRRRP